MGGWGSTWAVPIASLMIEKYLNKINRLNALDIIKVNQQKEVEIGVADANSDYLLYDELKKELTIPSKR